MTQETREFSHSLHPWPPPSRLPGPWPALPNHAGAYTLRITQRTLGTQLPALPSGGSALKA